MSIFEPLKIIFKGNLLPGFIVKVNSHTSLNIDDKIDIESIETDVLPEIEESVHMITDHLIKDK